MRENDEEYVEHIIREDGVTLSKHVYKIINGDTKLYLDGLWQGFMEPLNFNSKEPIPPVEELIDEGNGRMIN